MKTLSLFALALVLCAAGPATVRAQVQEQPSTEAVNFDLFYDALEPYGDWISVDGYGFCWRPEISMEDPNWRPYTVGKWAWTGGGWTWMSDEEFGWAVYHYGRWVRLEQEGWVWVPGYDWAPAWVAWRSTQDQQYVGWAPLPPEAEFDPKVGFSDWVDRYYDIGPDYYTFVTVVSFGDRRMCDVVVPRHRNVLLMTNSINVTNIYYLPTVTNHLFVGGPDYDHMHRHCRAEIPVLRLECNDRIDYNRLRYHSREYSPGLCHVSNGALFVPTPRFHHHDDDRRFVPQHVKALVQAPVINRGWSSSNKNPNIIEELRDKIHGSKANPLPKVLPPKLIVGSMGRDKDKYEVRRPEGMKPTKVTDAQTMIRPGKPVAADNSAEKRMREFIDQQKKKADQARDNPPSNRPTVIVKPPSSKGPGDKDGSNMPHIVQKKDRPSSVPDLAEQLRRQQQNQDSSKKGSANMPHIVQKKDRPSSGPDAGELARRQQMMEQARRQKDMEDQKRRDSDARAKAMQDAQRRMQQAQQQMRQQSQPKPSQGNSGGGSRGRDDKDDDKKKKKH